MFGILWKLGEILVRSVKKDAKEFHFKFLFSKKNAEEFRINDVFSKKRYRRISHQ
jgi:hypothetical protein